MPCGNTFQYGKYTNIHTCAHMQHTVRTLRHVCDNESESVEDPATLFPPYKDCRELSLFKAGWTAANIPGFLFASCDERPILSYWNASWYCVDEGVCGAPVSDVSMYEPDELVRANVSHDDALV